MPFTELENRLTSTDAPAVREDLVHQLGLLESKLAQQLRCRQTPRDFNTAQALRDATRIALWVVQPTHQFFNT